MSGEVQPAPQHGMPGKTLAAQRESMGWTVEQVADQLKLAVRQVVALEEGDYDNLPGPAVVRGFVRAYAKVVKLDAAPLVAQIALDTPVVNDTSLGTVRRESKPTTFSQTRYPSNGKRARKLPLGLIGAAVVLAGIGAAAWKFGVNPMTMLGNGAAVATVPGAGSATTGADASVSVLPPPLVANAPPAAQTDPNARPLDAHKPVITNPVPLISVPPPSPSGTPAPGTGSPAGVNAATPAGVNPAAAAAVAPSNALVLTVREDSWIEVRPLKGKALFSGLVKGGRVETITVTEPVTLIVGKPTAVDATLRGAPLALQPVPGGRVARVPIK